MKKKLSNNLNVQNICSVFFILRWNVLLNQNRGWYGITINVAFFCLFLSLYTLSKVKVKLCLENSPVNRFKTATM